MSGTSLTEGDPLHTKTKRTMNMAKVYKREDYPYHLQGAQCSNCGETELEEITLVGGDDETWCTTCADDAGFPLEYEDTEDEEDDNE